MNDDSYSVAKPNYYNYWHLRNMPAARKKLLLTFNTLRYKLIFDTGDIIKSS